jgi:putative endonuclease
MTGLQTHYAYLLLCSDGSFYAGYTIDLQKRLATHLSGKASKYTRNRLPVKLVYWENFSSKGEALSREAKLKKLNHQQKLVLASKFDNE